MTQCAPTPSVRLNVNVSLDSLVLVLEMTGVQVRDLLLWQDVYVGEGSSLQGGKELISSQGGSGEGSENGGENALVEEIDKLQVTLMSS